MKDMYEIGLGQTQNQLVHPVHRFPRMDFRMIVRLTEIFGERVFHSDLPTPGAYRILSRLNLLTVTHAVCRAIVQDRDPTDIAWLKLFLSGLENVQRGTDSQTIYVFARRRIFAMERSIHASC